VLNDLRYALRLIRNTPVASGIALLTVAIGVGANTAIFSIIRAVLLKPLPYADADRLVQISESWPSLPGPRPISRLNYYDWVAQSDVFERIAAVSWGSATVGTGDHPFWVDGSLVSPSYFDVFGLRAEIGRTFAPNEDQPGHDRVVVLSHRLWTSRFGGDRAIVGSAIRLDGELYTVIGVMPDGGRLHFYDTPVWRPLVLPPSSRAARDLQFVEAKLKPGVTIAQARAQMNAIADRLARQYPDANKGYGVIVEPFPRPVGLGVEASLYLLCAAVGIVLLIGCVNLANLAIVRGAARAREIAIRAALGASRARIARQFLTEHLVIAVGGGVAGVAIGYAILRAMIPWIPTAGLRTAYPEGTVIAIDRAVWLFAMAVSMLSGIAFGLAPAVGGARRSLVETIRDGTPGVTVGRGQKHLGHVLVVAEVALAFVLLTGAGLLIQSFFTLTRPHRCRVRSDQRADGDAADAAVALRNRCRSQPLHRPDSGAGRDAAGRSRRRIRRRHPTDGIPVRQAHSDRRTADRAVCQPAELWLQGGQPVVLSRRRATRDRRPRAESGRSRGCASGRGHQRDDGADLLQGH
jgi:putative ABC transport system permease protein